LSNYAKKYSFQSIGELATDLDERNSRVETPVLPVGIKVPLALSDGSSDLIKMHTNYDDALADNFRNMIMTNHGERLGHYDFGANLKELAFELGSETGDTKAIRRIMATTQKYMPYISLDSFEPLSSDAENGLARVGVKITYSIPNISNKTRVIEVTIFSAG
jgi:phage baseplate assembly protein W